MDRLRQDLAFALRTFARRPGFSLLVLLTFGLGVGATTAMFSVVDAVLLRPLPYPEPNRIVSIYPTLPEWRNLERLSEYWESGRFSWPEFQEFRKQQRSYQSLGAYSGGSATLVSDAPAERIGLAMATPDFFTALGARVQLGRLFAAEDDASVIVLTHGLWSSHFGSDRDVLGRTLRTSNRSYTIVGVLAPEFEFLGIDAAAWRPLTERSAAPGGGISIGSEDHYLSAVGRLNPAISPAQASAEAERLIAAFSVGDHVKHGGRVIRRHDDLTNAYRFPLFVLIGAAFLLLAAACASVATMLLGAGMDREQEIAIRGALGAQRHRLFSQLLTEGLLLGVAGALLGVLVAQGVLGFLLQLAPAGLPRLAQATLDMRVLLFASITGLLFAVGFTLMPAIVLSRVSFAGPASAARVTRSARGRLQSGLVVAEVALATILLVGAGLLTRTMQKLNAVDPGFDADNLLTVRVAPDFARFRVESDPDGFAQRLGSYFTRIVDDLRALPGVNDVAVAATLPFTGDRASNDIRPEGYTPRQGESLDAERRFVSANYFDVMRMRFVEGRGFSAADEAVTAEPLIVVNRELARRFFPGQSAVGKRLVFRDQPVRVIGVVQDPIETDLRGESSMKFYVTTRRMWQGAGSIIVRADGEPAELGNSIRQRIRALDPNLPITGLQTMRDLMGNTVAHQRYRMRLMLAFSALAAVFSVMGVYGILNRTAVRRRREMGIRSALGALQSQLLGLILRQGVALVGIGVAAGLLTALFASRLLESFLYGVGRNDPVVLLGIVALNLVLALLAALQPARRAARVQPMEVLRGE